MKEKLYTIELTDAVKAGDECLFCWLERKLEQENLEFVLGSSYMESDIRDNTSERGFCRHHTKMMFDYRNSLGNAWILKSRMEKVNRDFKKQMGQAGAVEKGGSLLGRLFSGRKQTASVYGPAAGQSGASAWLRGENSHCYICERMDGIYQRMLDTFVYMLKNDTDFGELLMASKGFCLPHFADVLDICQAKLTAQEQEVWIPRLTELTSRNLDRIQ